MADFKTRKYFSRVACLLLTGGIMYFGVHTAEAAKPARKQSEVRKEKQQTEKEIAKTRQKINETEKKITTQLNRLSDIDSQIERQESVIGELTGTIDRLSERADRLRDSIAGLVSYDSLLCLRVASNLRHQHAQRKRISALSFVTGASGVSDAIRRINYLNTLQRAQNKVVRQLRAKRRQIEIRRLALDSVVANSEKAVKQLATAKNILDARRQESQKVVNGLRSENQELTRVLNAKQQRIKQLNAELDRIIANEQRKAEAERKAKEAARKKAAANKTTASSTAKNTATTNNTTTAAKTSTTAESPKKTDTQGVADAERALTGSFAANKGKLLFPVAGRYNIIGTFGRSQHEELSHVQLDNSGIDISVAAGTKARSSFDGTVSSIFFMDGYENIVIVRHGEYLTVYAGLSSINIKKGQPVSSGQTIGTVATIGGNTVLHFEVRKEKAKLNPLQWVK